MSVIVKKFSASWCAPCRRLAPIFESTIKPQYDTNVVTFQDVDVDTDYEGSIAYNVKSVPTVVIERDGVVLETITGLQSVRTYVDAINASMS